MMTYLCSCLKSKSLYPPVLLLAGVLFFSLFGANSLRAQCNPNNDTIPPNAVCSEFLTVAIGPDNPNDCYVPDGAKKFSGVAWVKATTFDQGSYDDCNNIHITVQRQAPYSGCVLGLNPVNGQAPCNVPGFPSEFERAISEGDSIKLYACEAGTSQTVIMRVYQLTPSGQIALDGLGQPIVTACLTTVEVEDKSKPVCQAPANVTVSCENFDPSLLTYGPGTFTDNACLDTVITTVNYGQFDTLCNKGTILRTFRAYDCSGNSQSCSQQIVVNYVQDYYVRFPNDVIVTSPSGNYFGEPVFFGKDCELMGVTYSDQIFTVVPDADVKIERTWSIINWCTFDPGLPLVAVPNPEPNATPNHPSNLVGPTVSASGTPAPWNPTIAKLLPSDPNPTDFSIYYNPNANGYTYTQTIKITNEPQAIITGKVFLDTLDNCGFDTGEPLLQNWTVKVSGLVTGEVYETQANSSGIYTLLLPAADTVAEVTLSVPFNFGQNCPSVYTINPQGGQTTTQDVPVHLETSCPLLSVDLTAPFLRRCFSNTYTVQACNLGTETVDNVSVEVTLDSYMSYTGSSVSGTALGGNAYSFEVGSLAAGECSDFTITFGLDCAAPIGYTHCTQAHIYPDTICNPPALWSGSNLNVTGQCDGDSVRMTVTNTGTGDMSQATDFVVTEDVIMYQSGPIQLNKGASQTITVPANGATWFLAAQQEVNHPWGGQATAVVEGCGGLNTTGLVNMFPMNSPNPFETSDCQQNIGSFDPNDKQAFPTGYGNQHLLEANTDIEYLIRFQNTGTDTAFTVVVLDTLSTALNAQSARPGVASHPYDFAVLDGNILRFRFDHINLLDSGKDEAASHGFIKFRVPQQPNNPDGTLIENQAAIYFDFNDPVLTNTTFHTIGQHFILVSTQNPGKGPRLNVYPNPSTDAVLFEMEAAGGQSTFVLTDGTGQTLLSERFPGTQYRFERGQLPPGIYLYQITTGQGQTYSGKVMLK